jgi:hypothetical protein
VEAVPAQKGLAILHNALCYLLWCGWVMDAMIFLQGLFWGYLGILEALPKGGL